MSQLPTSESSGRGAGRGRGRGNGSIRSRDSSVTRPGANSGDARGVGREQASVAGSATSGGSGGSAGSGGSGGSAASTVSKTSTSSSGSSTFTMRPDNGGSLGRPIPLKTNNFYVNFNNDLVVQQYVVTIQSEYREAKTEDCFAVFWEANYRFKFITEPHTAIYDGAGACYSLHLLNLGKDNPWQRVVEVNLPKYQRPQKYSISIGLLGEQRVNFSSQETKTLSLTILDVAYRQAYNTTQQGAVSKRKFAPYGPNFFYIPTPGDRMCFDLDGMRQAWTGFFLAAKWASGQVPILNVDVANGVFIKPQSVLAFLCEVLNVHVGRQQYNVQQLERLQAPYYLNRNEAMAFELAIKGLQVEKKGEPGRAYKVTGVTDEAAEKMLFDWRRTKDGPVERISVAEYYEKRYGKLKCPFFPCVISKNKKKGDAYFPLEVCEIYSPQKVRGRLTEIQTSSLIKGVCTDAVERERRVMDMIKLAGLDSDPVVKKFGFTLKNQMIEMKGRVLNPPALEYFGNMKAMPREGAWNVQQNRLLIPVSIPAYGMVSFIPQNSKDDLKTFCQNLMGAAKQLGLQVTEQFPCSVIWTRSNDNLLHAFETCIRECEQKGKECEFILVAMPARDSTLYASIKTISERQLGLSTQVVIMRSIRKPTPQTCANIVLKINAKLGGVNWKLFPDVVQNKYLISQNTLVLGVDVTHPTAVERKMPSIGAAVGNIDLLPGKFGASINVQPYRRESVVYLKQALEARVEAFWRHTKEKPERILVYRDGVDEGHFKKVMDEETKSIELACRNHFGESYKPKITFIIVQKRHHCRLFCCNPGDASGRGRNVPAGTVVDSVATHPSQFDYYLCSHYGIQGTSRPAHYHVLRDDNEFTSDELQAITYQLCHLYARCTRSVSIPAPTYYAHLACERARHHLHSIGDLSELDEDDAPVCSAASVSSSASSTCSEDEIVRAVNVKEPLLAKMYFC